MGAYMQKALKILKNPESVCGQNNCLAQYVTLTLWYLLVSTLRHLTNVFVIVIVIFYQGVRSV